ERRRHEDHGRIGAGFIDRVAHGVEHREADVLAAALAGRNAADQLGAVIQRLLRMEGALLAGEALADDLGVFVDQYAHDVETLHVGWDELRSSASRLRAMENGGIRYAAPALPFCLR